MWTISVGRVDFLLLLTLSKKKRFLSEALGQVLLPLMNKKKSLLATAELKQSVLSEFDFRLSTYMPVRAVSLSVLLVLLHSLNVDI